VRSLITGVGGFAGSHLAEALLSAAPEAEVWGCDLGRERRPYHPAALHLLGADLRDPAAVQAVVQACRPDQIYHLAGQAFAGDSWSNPWQTLETNLRGTVNLLEAVLAGPSTPRILVVASSEVYGRATQPGQPIAETFPLGPDNPYGVSKAAQDLLAHQYYLSRQLAIVRVRPFNHIGPRQNRRFVAPAFASQIAAIEAGRQPPVVRVGNLSARRDLTDVRDMVQAYRLALELGQPGEVYNLGSGRSHSMQDLLNILLSFARVPITVEVDPARLRPSDVPDVVCDASKFRAATGWAPRIPIEQSLQDLLEYERSHGE
jgi:GDP-4-dehydro-6-deoxy-D-mannose reductase